MKQLLLILLLVGISWTANADNKTYGEVIAEKTCKTSTGQQRNCRYRVGKDLDIEIAGIGQSDTAIVFYSSSFAGDYYGKVGILHGCVIVAPGRKSNFGALGNHAFISPINGKVYKTWDACHSRH
jgi:hypothetical protein